MILPKTFVQNFGALKKLALFSRISLAAIVLQIVYVALQKATKMLCLIAKLSFLMEVG